VPLNALYVVPAWVADDVGGSSADLEEREVVSLEDLMYLSLLISGNDAAHAIADLLHNSGGPWEAVPAFVDEMNARAQQLGMNNTAFNNPNGFEQEAVGPDMGDHYSTAWDMEILSRAAMLNPLFREISNATEWTALRLRQDGLFEHNFSSFQSWVLDNGWGMHGTGIKGGWTPGARNTWCVSAEDHGRVIATSFGTDRLTSSMTDAFRLLTLGLDGCGTWSVDEGWELEYLYVNDRIVAVANDREIYSMGPVVPASMQLDLFRTSSEPLGTNAIMRIRRETQLGIENNETVPFGIAPFDGLEGIWVRNLADWTVKTFIQVEGNGDFYDIPPDGTVQIPINPAPSSQLSWSITSHGADEGDGGPVPLSVQEIYSYDVQAGPEPSEPVLSVVVERSDASANDLINLEIDWFEDGGEYLLVVHDSDVVVGVDGIDVEAGASAGLLQLAPPAPNPFRDQTRIRLALREEAGVSVSIHDASGRLVREYPEATRPAGVWSLEWDGRNGRGSAASPGVYFFRVVVNGEPMGDGKLVRLE